MAETVDAIITPKFRASFVWVFKPKADKRDPLKKPKYSVLMLFPKGTDLSALKAAAKAAAIQKWGSDADAKLKHPKFKSPFKDQATLVDGEGKPYAGVMEGGVAVEAWSYTAPGLAGPKLDPSTGKVEILTAETDFYSGAWARAKIRPYAWTNDLGGIGLSFDLVNLQKLADDDRLGGGRTRAEDDFQPVEASVEGGEGGAGDFFG
ncbi:ssDNA-binding protein [Methylobacterium brachiatum]|uniref:ssDNA-binding protein n=1 Tax=Methylobacterium brachiatum TaxID=269660 RepID=UPI0008F208E0|nr:ssDNA-binding protein [Methylobacterium brachiatum]SFJ68956.1 Protein of unknown function [Methylobacterium brachiatum]